jgi:hypothetical protein
MRSCQPQRVILNVGVKRKAVYLAVNNRERQKISSCIEDHIFAILKHLRTIAYAPALDETQSVSNDYRIAKTSSSLE